MAGRDCEAGGGEMQIGHGMVEEAGGRNLGAEGLWGRFRGRARWRICVDRSRFWGKGLQGGGFGKGGDLGEGRFRGRGVVLGALSGEEGLGEEGGGRCVCG